MFGVVVRWLVWLSKRKKVIEERQREEEREGE